MEMVCVDDVNIKCIVSVSLYYYFVVTDLIRDPMFTVQAKPFRLAWEQNMRVSDSFLIVLPSRPVRKRKVEIL